MKLVVGATWDDAPHLSQERREELYAALPPYQRDARTKGVPQLGAGAIYPFPETEIKVADFPIPAHWRQVFGLDTALSGVTAAVWAAYDTEKQQVFITSVYKRSQAETAVHVEAIKGRGAWIPGVGDAAGIIDFERTRHLEFYRKAGLDLELPDKSVEVGIAEVYNLLSGQKLHIFASCSAWFEEFRLYRRDDKGRVVKKNDHLMDATRYLVRSGLSRAKTQPVKKVERTVVEYDEGSSASLSWMR